MRLLPTVEFITAGNIPMLGNLATGGVIGLTAEGSELCQEMRLRDVSPDEVPDSCKVLVEHLSKGGYLAGDGGGHQPKLRRLSSAYLHVTQRCNLSCAFCYSDDEGRNRLQDPTLEQLSRAIDLLASLGCKRIVVSGGEPFLRSDLTDIAQYARNAGIATVAVLTNGLLVTPQRLAPLAGLIDTIGIAFDGTSKDAPAHLRGTQNYPALVESVKHVVASGITARIIPTIHGKNLQDMPAYRSLATSLGAELSFSMLTGCTSELGDLRLSESQLQALAENAISNQMALDEDLSGSTGIALSAKRTCGAGTRTLSIAADGTIYPCHMLHTRELAMGNAFVDTPAAKALLMESEVRQQLSELSVDGIEKCKNCSLRYLCGGGCRARAYVNGFDLLGNDPYATISCSYYAMMVTLLERRFGKR